MNTPTSTFAHLIATALFLASGFLACGQSPVAFTQPAGPVRATNATLNGMALAKGNPTLAWFEWGPNAQYGAATVPVSIGTSQSVVRVSAPITDLVKGGVYHYRLVASNAVGIARGFDQVFTTGMRVQNWGSYSYGLPAVPPGLTNLVAVAAGHGHCLAIRNDGTVAGWTVGFAYPKYGQANVPSDLSNVVAVAGGYSHSLALKEDGTVVGWGKYSDGTAVNVPAWLTNVIAIAGGDYHSVALKRDGTVVAWGGNSSSQTNVPGNLRNVVAISCGSSHSLALTADGRVTVWGNDFGSVTPPSAATNVVAVATEGWYNLALRADSTVVDWGLVNTDVPKPKLLTNVVVAATGFGYGEVLKADGTLQAWGRGYDATNIPPMLSNLVAFASGDYHCLGLAPVNLPPNFPPRSIYGEISQDLTISVSGYDPNGDPLTTRITSLPAKGRLFQFTPTGRGDEITTPGTYLVDPLHLIFVPEPDGYGSAYAAFDLAVSDGELEAAPSYTITILPRPILESPIILTGSTNALVLNFGGVDGARYSVYYSSSLSLWYYLGPANQAGPGQFSFTDSTFTNSAVRFYRIRSP